MLTQGQRYYENELSNLQTELFELERLIQVGDVGGDGYVYASYQGNLNMQELYRGILAYPHPVIEACYAVHQASQIPFRRSVGQHATAIPAYNLIAHHLRMTHTLDIKAILAALSELHLWTDGEQEAAVKEHLLVLLQAARKYQQETCSIQSSVEIPTRNLPIAERFT
jgi:hypothetical protein